MTDTENEEEYSNSEDDICEDCGLGQDGFNPGKDCCASCECPNDCKCLLLCEKENGGKCPYYPYDDCETDEEDEGIKIGSGEIIKKKKLKITNQE